MNIDEKIEIAQRRQYLVVKDNKLIQQSRFDLSVPEQKTIGFICSMIKPIDPKDSVRGIPFKLEYEFNINDYCKVCGIDYDNGKNYKDIKATLKRLSDRSMWLNDGQTETLVRWLSFVEVKKRSGKITIEVDRTIVHYLFDLKESFTKYQLYNILSMKSAFSIRVYELMKSYAFKKTKTFDLDDLKILLGVENVKSYNDFSLFRQKVLETAEKEINKLTDINISFEAIKKGQKVVKVKFFISEKKRMQAFEIAQKYINPDLI